MVVLYAAPYSKFEANLVKVSLSNPYQLAELTTLFGVTSISARDTDGKIKNAIIVLFMSIKIDIRR